MLKEIRVPDLGNVSEAAIIEVQVKPGDKINENDSIITLESDKASMDIPAPFAGTVKEMKVKVGDKVSSNHLILLIETEASAPAEKSFAESAPVSTTSSLAETAKDSVAAVKEIKVPDLGNVSEAAIIEVQVKPGDVINENGSLITLESDKASMDIPAPFAGTVKEILVKVGDKVSSGKTILTLETKEQSGNQAIHKEKSSAITAEPATSQVSTKAPPIANTNSSEISAAAADFSQVHAGPAVRRLAREFGIDLTKVAASGPKGRILKEDLQNHVKKALAGGSPAATSTAGGLPQPPHIDFSQFGEIENQPLSRIKKLTAINLHRNWLLVPHVTQFDEADITELENFRKAQQIHAEKLGIKLTPLVFIMKAVVNTLQAFPTFNASLDPSGEQLILKKYFHIGVAVDTPDGLVVPVIRNVNKKGLLELAKELAEISARARKKELKAAEMQGSSFTISSLGGIGGTAFTPIVNLPDVAILGVSKASIKPVFQDGQFVPRLMLPLSLSYDHRVIDGAEGARFIVHLTQGLHDMRRWLL